MSILISAPANIFAEPSFHVYLSFLMKSKYIVDQTHPSVKQSNTLQTYSNDLGELV